MIKKPNRPGPLWAVLAAAALLGACSNEESAPAVNTGMETAAESKTQDDPIATAVDAMTEAAYRRHVETLASDEFGGRAPASPGEELTVSYLVEHFRSIGLEPGNGGSYTQDVPLAWVETVNSPDLVFSGGEGEDMVLAYGPDQVRLEPPADARSGAWKTRTWFLSGTASMHRSVAGTTTRASTSPAKPW